MSDPDKTSAALMASLEAQLAEVVNTHRPRGREEAKETETEAEAEPAPRLRAKHRRDPNWAGRREAPATGQSLDATAQQAAVPLGRGKPHTITPITPLQLPPDRRREEAPLLLPQRRSRRSYGSIISFILCVVLPTIVAAVYYLALASNRYEAEFRFAVRQSFTAGATTPTSAVMSPISGSAVSTNFVDNYMVADYLTSRQLVDELQAKINVKALYSRPTIDWWSRFDASKPMEKFLSYWQNVTSANYDQVTGLAIVHIYAFTPEDAYLIAKTMVSLSENLVNEVGRRPLIDAVKFAEQDVRRAQDDLKSIRDQLAQYRDKEAVIEPNSSVVTSNTVLAQSLRTALTQYQTDLSMLLRQHLRADSPQIKTLQARVFAAQKQLTEVESQIGTSRQGSQPLSTVVGRYEDLDLRRTTAQTILTNAIQTLEQARANALTQHLYITPFVRPARPESSTAPNRPVAIMTIGLACFLLWTIGLLFFRSIREHLA